MHRLSTVVLAFATALVGCSGGASSLVGPELFTYTATTQVTSTSPMRFQASVIVKNGTSDAITFVPGCGTPRLLVYTTAARTGTPFYDSNSGVACTGLRVQVTLGAGQSVTYTIARSGSEVLGTTGAPGTYYLVAETTLSGVPTDVDAGQVNLTR